MRFTRLTVGLTLVFAAAAGWPACILARPPDKETPAMAFHDEIQLLNLLGSLWLTQAQLTTMLPLAQEAAQGREVLRKRMDELQTLFMGPGQVLRNALARGDRVEDHMAGSIHQLKRQQEELQTSHEEFEKGLADRMIAVLDDNQKQRLLDYKPCLVPTPDLRDPDRIGSSSPTGDDGPLKLLDKARKVPDARFEARREEMPKKLLEKVEKHYAGLDLAAFRTRVEQVVTRARAMSALEYETSRENLAQELKPPEANRRHRDKETAEGRARHFLLRPCVPKLIQERLHLLTLHQPPQAQVDLGHVQAQVNCKDGKCALNR